MSKILTYPNKVLRKKSEEIRELDKKTLKDINFLIKELESAENGAGLAAPQVGISKRFFGIKDENKEVKVFINPKVIKSWGEKVYSKTIDEMKREEDFLEGCLSFPDYFGTVKRFLKIKVAWQEKVGNNLIDREEVLEGYRAIVWQHESDHLDGIVFVDRVKEEGGKFYKWDGKEMISSNVGEVLKND